MPTDKFPQLISRGKLVLLSQAVHVSIRANIFQMSPCFSPHVLFFNLPILKCPYDMMLALNLGDRVQSWSKIMHEIREKRQMSNVVGIPQS